MTLRRRLGLSTAEQYPQHQSAASIKLKLNALARASTLEVFTDANDWARSMCACLEALLQDTTGKGSYLQLLECFYSSISKGLKQLHTHWPQDDLAADYQTSFQAAILTIEQLCAGLTECQDCKPYTDVLVKQEVSFALKAGFLQHLAPVISRLLVCLQPLQQPSEQAIQQYTAIQLHLATLGAFLLQKWSRFFQSSLGDDFTDSILAPTVHPVTSLALLLMRTAAVETTRYDSNSALGRTRSSKHSSPESESGTTGTSFLWMLCCETCIDISNHLILAATVGCMVYNSGGNNIRPPVAAARAAVLSADVQRMMLLGVAAAAAAVHKQHAAAAKAGRKASQKQHPQQRGQSGYLHLLAGLGIETSSTVFESALGYQSTADCKSNVPWINTAISTISECLQQQQQQQQHSNVTADSRLVSARMPSDTTQPFTVEQSVLQQLAIPVLHTLKDIILLLPDTEVDWHISIFSSLSCVSQLFCRSTEPKYQQQQQLVQWLLQPLYSKVCRVVRGQQQALDAGAGALVLQYWSAATTAVLSCVVNVGHAPWPPSRDLPDPVVAVIKQQPVTSLTAFETMLRVGNSSWSNNHVIIDKQLQQSLPELSVRLSRYLHNTWDAEEETMLDKYRVQQQLFSLICSQLKCMVLTTSTASEQQSSLSDQQQQAYECLAWELRSIRQMLRYHFSAANHSQASAKQQAAPSKQQLRLVPAAYWVALLGRAVHGFAASMLQHCITDTTVISRVLDSLSLVERVADLVFVQHLPDVAAAAEVEQQLGLLKQSPPA